MGRFLLRLTCFCALQLVVFGIVMRFGRERNRPVRHPDHYLLSMEDKLELLRMPGRARLIFVGGSNVAFGINSHCFAEALPRLPVNMGLHASLGLWLPLRLVQQELRAGDVVVVMPEFYLLNSEPFGDTEFLTKMADLCPETEPYVNMVVDRRRATRLREFTDHEAFYALHGWVRAARKRMSGTSHRAATKRFPIFARKQKGIYRRSGFNQFGDMVAHYGLPSKPLKGMEPITEVSHEHVAEAVDILNQFAASCRRRGATALFSFSPIPRPRLQESRDAVDQIVRILQDTLEMPIVNQPQQLAFPMESFYDTAHHLTQSGAEVRSEALLDAIAPHLSLRERVSVAARRGGGAYR